MLSRLSGRRTWPVAGGVVPVPVCNRTRPPLPGTRSPYPSPFPVPVPLCPAPVSRTRPPLPGTRTRTRPRKRSRSRYRLLNLHSNTSISAGSDLVLPQAGWSDRVVAPSESIIITAAATRQRFEAAGAWLREQPRSQPILIVGASAQAAAELARASLGRGESTFGWRRLSLTRLATWIAEDVLAARQLAPATMLAIEAVWTRVVHRLDHANQLGVFAGVADRPGLARALARTVHELRMAAVDLTRVPADLSRVVRYFDDALSAAGLVDRAKLFEIAAEVYSAGCPVLLYDLPIHHPVEGKLIAALCARAPRVFATVPSGDSRARAHLEQALGTRASSADRPPGSALETLQHHLFSASPPQPRPADDDVSLLSAPGEGRECVEIARRIHKEAREGVQFDRMAVLLRAPGHYRTAIAEALRRAGIPAHFARGTLLPDPSGRALLALLACAGEGLSARRFAEYLSLGEVSHPDAEGAPPEADGEAWAASEEPELGDDPPSADELPDVPDFSVPPRREPPRAPRKWEQILVDAAVIGGRDRWERRLDGHAESLRRALDLAEGEEAWANRLQNELAQLEALRRFSLPLIAELEALPRDGATWGEWLTKLAALATRALRNPERVLAFLSQLAPMSDVGPVTLREVRLVLGERLADLTRAPSRRREGRVFVGSIDDARGLSFDIVFVPGLAERIFPQKLTDDPILADEEREAFGGGLATRRERAWLERLHLHLAVGAAEKRISISYPRLDSEQVRPRVPSFYALEVIRAAEGALPNFTELARRAEGAAAAQLGWPAPKDPDQAIDVIERDLATLEALFHHAEAPPESAARYLLNVNPYLARALRRHGRRMRRAWGVADGLLKASAEAVEALRSHRFEARAYSPTVLQHFAICPYRFFLSAIHKLSPREVPEPLEQLDPLQRGSLVHDAQFETLSSLRDQGLLPLAESNLPRALEILDDALHRVAEHHRELLAPAIERVWHDAVASIRLDLREWLRRVQRESANWAPWRFELSFGLRGREASDPHSTPEPVQLENAIRLRGSIDMVEQSPTGALRATDHKTGKARADRSAIVGGGEKLQPVLYALALEKLFPAARVEGGRLFYCTQAGGFEEVTIRLDERARKSASEVARIIGSAVERGWFPAAPAKRACEYCDFLPVCGEGEEARTARKPKEELADLTALRELQ
jgi:ATP-dependent helicase/nuclease subunit B